MLKPTRLLLLGAPGSGKGTISKRLLKKFPQLQYISSGDVLRSQIANGTNIGIKAEKYLKNGALVPDPVMVRLISDQLKTHNWLNRKASWLLDGFPRTSNQAHQLNDVLDQYDSNLNLVVELDVDQKVILHRIESRYVHLPSGRIYSLDYNPPKVPFKDDVTGEPLVKREDDNAEVFQKRLDKYNEKIGALREYYQELGVWRVVSGHTSDIIYPQVEELLLL
ncbi:ADK2 [Candida theae]|uniref:GTP:AMP phosphotransferase, mitochondrial n=1 Tax=Candida theae TaxID=1198502 RepID=A0AAD5FXY0_9ASCO|nr:ADK2 [Candida theae]KAI5955955.1 ADK2 [Candida theae]